MNDPAAPGPIDAATRRRGLQKAVAVLTVTIDDDLDADDLLATAVLDNRSDLDPGDHIGDVVATLGGLAAIACTLLQRIADDNGTAVADELSDLAHAIAART